MSSNLRERIIIVLSVFLIVNAEVQAQEPSLKITWLGTTTILVSDGTTTLLFDPFISRPSLLKVFTFRKLSSDKKLVHFWLKKVDENNITKGIFVSHTHYDHALDLVEVARKTKATVYGSNSARKILLGGELDQIKFKKTSSNGGSIPLGEFKVTVLPGVHAPHLRRLKHTFIGGKISQSINKPSPFRQYSFPSVRNTYIGCNTAYSTQSRFSYTGYSKS